MVVRDFSLEQPFAEYILKFYWNNMQSEPTAMLCLLPADLPDPGISFASLVSPALAGVFFPTSTTQGAELTAKVSSHGSSRYYKQQVVHESFTCVLSMLFQGPCFCQQLGNQCVSFQIFKVQNRKPTLLTVGFAMKIALTSCFLETQYNVDVNCSFKFFMEWAQFSVGSFGGNILAIYHSHSGIKHLPTFH